jgi:hypothetical protein
MYAKEKFRVYATYCVSVFVGMSGFSLVVLSLLKVFYKEYPNDPFRVLLSNITKSTYNNFPPYRLIWSVLPTASPFENPLGFLFNGVVLLGLVLFIVCAIFANRALHFNTIINDATRIARLNGLTRNLEGPRYEQSTGPINAGGNVNIRQEIQQVKAANRELEEWDQSIWKGPIGGVLISLIATIAAAVITRITGLT